MPMRVLMASTSYPRDAGDWRGAFIGHLVQAIGCEPEVMLALWAPPGDVSDTVAWATTAEERDWLARLMEAGGISHLLRHPRPAWLLAPLTLLRRLSAAYRRHDTDLRHACWLQTALPMPRDGKPLVVSVLGNDLALLRLPLMRTAMRRALHGRRATLCPNADWMEEPLRAAFGDLATVETVPFGIDRAWYAIERRPDRATPRWLAVTRLTRAKLGPLFEWLAPHFADGKRRLDLIGPMQEAIELPAWVTYHGEATPTELGQRWFPAATALVTLSRHAEGRPQVMLEAMAAGLPILASALPAHADLIADGVDGLLCDSPATCAEALHRLEDAETNRRIGDAARHRVRAQSGTWDDCAQRYLRVYRNLLHLACDATPSRDSGARST